MTLWVSLLWGHSLNHCPVLRGHQFDKQPKNLKKQKNVQIEKDLGGLWGPGRG